MNHQRTFSNGIRRGRSDVPNWRSGASPAARGGGYQSHATSNSSSPPSGARTDEDDIHGNRGGAHDNLVHGRLLFLTMCLVGQFVDVRLKDGSVYSGIFHTANVDKDFSVVLKMARQIKEATGKSSKGDTGKQAPRKPPIKMLIIYAKDFAQICAKDVQLTGEAHPNGRSRENKSELLTDTLISQSRRESERVLKPWKPDSEAPKNLGLETTFHSSWNRSWDQFEINRKMFGVETTFDEELYTTKLERGPQTREREKEALRLAREIEGQSTRNIHLAEERGISDPELEDLDEESRFSSVLRRSSEGDDDHDSKSDSLNDETFGSAAPTETAPQDSASPSHGPSGSPRSATSAGDAGFQNLNAPGDDLRRDNRDQKKRKEQVNDLKSFSESLKDRNVKPDGRLPKSSSSVAKLADDLRHAEIKSSADIPARVTAPIHAPPASALPIPVALSNPAVASTSSGTTSSRSPSKTVPVTPSEPSREETEPAAAAAASSGSLAPASTASSGGVKKSALNPNAKEFKLNPNAKVFTPSFSAPRPASPITQQTPVYVPATVPVSPMHGMPVFVQQPGQPAQFAQYNSTMATSGASAAPFVQPSATFIPGSAAPPIKLPQTQPQVTASPYGQQQTIRYMPPLPGYPPPNFSQPVIYGQPPFVYVPQYQGMIPGQPLHMPPQPSSQLAQPPQKHAGAETNSPLVGQSPVHSPLPSPGPRSQPGAAAQSGVPAATGSSAGSTTTTNTTVKSKANKN